MALACDLWLALGISARNSGPYPIKSASPMLLPCTHASSWISSGLKRVLPFCATYRYVGALRYANVFEDPTLFLEDEDFQSTGTHCRRGGDHWRDASIKWDEPSFEQIVNRFPLAGEWDVTYPLVGQTTVDASAEYITLYADIFQEGNFRLPAINFFEEILSHYQFHISQLSLLGM
ncbi:hypothetical protein Hanom_Chr08g00705251 [Helianthus anomalus]